MRNESSTEPYHLRIPKCKENECTLEHVVKLTAQVIPSDLKEECKTDDLRFLNLKSTDRGPWKPSQSKPNINIILILCMIKGKPNDKKLVNKKPAIGDYRVLPWPHRSSEKLMVEG